MHSSLIFHLIQLQFYKHDNSITEPIFSIFKSEHFINTRMCRVENESQKNTNPGISLGVVHNNQHLPISAQSTNLGGGG